MGKPLGVKGLRMLWTCSTVLLDASGIWKESCHQYLCSNKFVAWMWTRIASFSSCQQDWDNCTLYHSVRPNVVQLAKTLGGPEKFSSLQLVADLAQKVACFNPLHPLWWKDNALLSYYGDSLFVAPHFKNLKPFISLLIFVYMLHRNLPFGRQKNKNINDVNQNLDARLTQLQ